VDLAGAGATFTTSGAATFVGAGWAGAGAEAPQPRKRAEDAHAGPVSHPQTLDFLLRVSIDIVSMLVDRCGHAAGERGEDGFCVRSCGK